jgi:hypothetical protein
MVYSVSAATKYFSQNTYQVYNLAKQVGLHVDFKGDGEEEV